jgi:hypothetical protein
MNGGEFQAGGINEKAPENAGFRGFNGEAGIRTRDKDLTPYSGLANRRLQPLGHLSRLAIQSLSGCTLAVKLFQRYRPRRPALRGPCWPRDLPP